MNVVGFLKSQLISMRTHDGNVEKENESNIVYDPYVMDAGRFIINKDKTSIGMIQRVCKIGFNRAAKIMDQLCEMGVVGKEEGTKPRKVLMNEEEFEKLIEEIIFI